MTATTTYFPPAGSWDRLSPADAGFDPAALEAAITSAIATEIDWPIEVGDMVGRNDTPRYNGILGPTTPRGTAGGVVIRHGHLIAQWGDPTRVDMTFSATKSYLATLVGLAKDRGLLGSLDEPIARCITDGGFDSEHNAAIT